MTSIAETRDGRKPSWLRTFLLVLLLVVGAAQTPLPWGALWGAVPAATAVALLVSWRFGAWALVVPALLAAAVPLAGGVDSLWAWWLPAAALTGVWMGMREERGAPAGQRAWMMLPALALAAALPWSARYPNLVAGVDRELRLGDAQMIEVFQQLGYAPDRLAGVQRAIEENAKLRIAALPHVLPTALFVWMALLMSAGRAFASRLTGLLRWPALTRARLLEWRLPDGALWAFLAGLGLLVSPWTGWAPTAWTLLLNSGLGYCVQGIAVVESLLLARGVPPSIIALTMVFVFLVAMPVFVLTTAAVGLSDVWLDYRRLEPAHDETPT
ncbi:MAG TPA: DUF2232 domain-containing protein [Candidatus Eisenbacteria bacterium]